MRMPICEQLVTTSQACEASTKQEMVTGLRLGTGRFGGISFCNPVKIMPVCFNEPIFRNIWH